MSLITKIKLIENKKDIELNLHDLLSDDADWNADYWLFEEHKLGDISDRIKMIYDDSLKGFIFTSLWAGDCIEKRLKVSIDTFLKLIRDNKIGTKTEYKITK